MQLEVEMANLSDESRDGMHSDLAQMDASSASSSTTPNPSMPTAWKASTWQAYWKTWRPSLPVCRTSRSPEITPATEVAGNGTELARVFSNLIENARRYGKTPGTDCAEIHAAASKAIRWWWTSLTMARRAGERMRTPAAPFTRLDTARGQANGSGLGLAIVNRIVLKHNGKLLLKGHEETHGGLLVQISCP
jgi:two-component system osmolarity sensor histidine kinase EnvZ